MKATSTILIVDDQPIGREALGELLYSPDYTLAFAANGPEALQLAAELTPDLILLDVMMPGMDGFEVCRRLRMDPRLAEVPVVLVTALDDQESRLEGIEAGADDFVTKPVNRAELRARVRTITRLNRYRRLVSQRQQFGWVVEQAEDGYLVLDAQDGVRYANPKARHWLGLVGEEVSLPPGTFRTLAKAAFHLEPEEAWLSWPPGSGASRNQPRYLVRPENRTTLALWLQVSVLQMQPDADAEYLLCLRDVTARMTARRDIRSFHGAIQHKLRTPFIAMLGGLELLAQDAAAMSATDVAELATDAYRGAQRLYNTVEDILQYLNTLHAAGAEGDCPLTVLNTLASSICADLAIAPPAVVLPAGQVVLPAGQGELHLRLAPRTLELLLWEILENAKKFHPSQSPILEISARQVDLHQITLSVTDDGIHLAPEQLAQVWEPYYQGDKYATGETPGMGLGLPLVAALTWGAGGKCRLSNRTDKPGIVVELTLPLAD